MAIDKNIIDGLINDFGINQSEVEFSTDIIDVILQKYISKWQSNLVKDNHNASDNLFQSLGSKKGEYGFKVEQSNGSLKIVLYLPDYYEYTDIGRRPTQKNGSGVVRQKLQGLNGWISQKGLVKGGGKTIEVKRKLKNGSIKTYTRKLTAAEWNKQLAFFISRKIHKKGFKGTQWFSREIPSFETEIINEITKLTGKIVELTVEKYTQS